MRCHIYSRFSGRLVDVRRLENLADTQSSRTTTNTTPPLHHYQHPPSLCHPVLFSSLPCLHAHLCHGSRQQPLFHRAPRRILLGPVTPVADAAAPKLNRRSKFYQGMAAMAAMAPRTYQVRLMGTRVLSCNAPTQTTCQIFTTPSLPVRYCSLNYVVRATDQDHVVRPQLPQAEAGCSLADRFLTAPKKGGGAECQSQRSHMSR